MGVVLMTEQELIKEIERLEYEVELYKAILQTMQRNKLRHKKALKNSILEF